MGSFRTFARTALRGLAAPLLGVGLLAGCAEGGTVDVGQDAGRQLPSALPGTWQVTGAQGEEPGLLVNWGHGEIEIFRDCGRLDGDWRAYPTGLFVGTLSGGAQPCFLGPNDDQDLDPRVEWLDGARRFRVQGERRELLGADGAVLATLVPATLPDESAESSSLGPDPTADPGDLPDLDADPAPLPAGLRPAARAELLGRWVPEGRAGAASDEGEPHIELDADGTWGGSDGCNGEGGAWTSEDGGTVLALSGASTLIGCENHQIASWLAGAASAGFDGDTLVLVDFAGIELGRVERDRT